MVYVFIIQFLNTGPILVLMNSHWSEFSIPYINRLKSGAFNDFTYPWYNDVGMVIVDTMVFTVGWPVIEFFVFYGMRLAYRLVDMRPDVLRFGSSKQ